MTTVIDPAAAPLAEAAARALEGLRGRLPSGAQAELYLCRSRERGIEMRDGRLETLQESRDEGMGLRVLQDGRLGFAYAGGIDPRGVEALLPRVLEQLPHVPPDEHRALPAAGKPASPVPEMTDESLFREPLQDLLPRLAAAQEETLRHDARVKRVLRLGYGESWSEVAIASTTGVNACEGGTHCSFGLAAMAEKENQVQVGSGSRSGRFHGDLDFPAAAREAAWRAAALLDARKLPSRRRSILFDPWVAGEFLDLIAGALSADQVQRGKSLFKGKLGQKVASPLVRLVDDPRRRRGIASATFDDEGVPTATKVMVEDGILREYFYDTYTARKDARASNGSAGRASYKGTPGPSSSNLFLEPGKTTRDALIKDTQEGLLLLEVMGMHTADPVSGEFSVGVSGLAVEGGRLGGGVRGAMLSGNILELLDRVDSVADDLTFYGRIAAPTFRVSDMMVA